MTSKEIYNDYKKSRVLGLEKIPSHWVESKFRYVTNLLTDYTANGSFKSLAENVEYIHAPDYARLIRLTDLRTQLKNDGIYVSEHSYNFLKKSALYGGEYLIANVGAYAGLVMQMPQIEGAATLGPNMMMAKFDSSKVLNKFMIYLSNSEYIQKQLMLKATSSSAQPKLNKEDFRTIEFIYPTLEEQEIIVKFLDKSFANINKIIQLKEKEKTLLEEKHQSIITEVVTKGLNPKVIMKASSVKWIEEIPEHWQVSKIKQLASVMPSNVDKKIVEGESEVLLCNYVDVYYNNEINSSINFMKATAKEEQIEKFTLQKHDVIITKDSESSTDIAIPTWVAKDLPGVICGYHLALIRPNRYLLGHYLYYTLETLPIREQFYSQANGVTRFGLGKEAIKNGLIPVPPYEEQVEIATHLYEKNKVFEETKRKINSQIEKLKEYRQSLLYEAVTGKIDVRELVIEKMR